MKKAILFFVLIFMSGMSIFAQTVTLTFTGRDANNQYVRLNRVLVKNVTQGWQETLFWPDTVLIMQVETGIGDVETFYGASLQLSQNNPNPFDGTTYAKLTLAEPGDVTVEITDVIGRVVEIYYGSSLQAGIHQLRVNLSTAGMYFLTARQNGHTTSIKMVNRGNGGADGIAFVSGVESPYYDGSATIKYQQKNGPRNITNNVFHLGDQMEYVGFGNINSAEKTSLRIIQAQNGSENFTLQIPALNAVDAQPCPATPTINDIDGNAYNTVQIGSQCWLKKNLRTTRYADGTVIPMADSTSYTEPLRYAPNNGTNYLAAYGYLYNWAAVMHGETSSSGSMSGVQGICPTGWHVPNNVEWNQLTSYVSSKPEYRCIENYYKIGKALSSKTGWNSFEDAPVCWMGNVPSTNNATGFAAYPAGVYPSMYSDYVNNGLGGTWWFWSATSATDNSAYVEAVNDHSEPSTWYSSSNYDKNTFKDKGMPVRCVQNNGLATVSTFLTQSTSALPAVSAGGEVLDSGEGEIIARGVCWGTEHNPTILEGNHTIDGTGVGTFTSSITGLTRGVTYYVRAYVTNSEGTAYGNEESIIYTRYNENDGSACPNAATLTDVDGNIYNTVLIGDQCWMKENLRTTRYANGTIIPIGTHTSTITPYRYNPGNDENNVPTYGYLYNWPAVMHDSEGSDSYPSGVQGICPTGWHVPSLKEWNQLINYVRVQSPYQCYNQNIPGKALASTSGWINYDGPGGNCAVGYNQNTNNATGFTAMPAGHYDESTNHLFGSKASFWTSSYNIYDYVNDNDNYGGYAKGLYMIYNNATVFNSSSLGNMYFGFSVRCLRD